MEVLINPMVQAWKNKSKREVSMVVKTKLRIVATYQMQEKAIKGRKEKADPTSRVRFPCFL